jgi:hypothetical protein
MRTRKQDSDATTMTSTTKANTTTLHSRSSVATAVGGRNPQRSALFQKSTRKNQEFERFLCNGQEAAVLDATTSKYIPLSYFVTPHTTASPHPNPYTTTSSEASAVGGRTSSRHAHGLADKMPFESFKLINLQQRGSHAHSLVLFKSRAITTNPEQIAIFECNGQYVQSEIRVIHTYHPDAAADDEPGTVYDVTENYFSPISPKVCMNYGNDRYNPGYCGIFGMIAMIFFRGGVRPPTAGTSFDKGAASCPGEVVGGEDLPTAEGERWIRKWTQLLKYMRQDIPDEPESHGCMGTNLAARVQEIIAAHPSTATGHQNAEKEINALLKQVRKTFKHN